MGLTAMAVALMVLTLVAACFLWTLLFRFEEFHPVAEDPVSHPRRVGLLFRTLTGLTTVGVFAVLLLEFYLLVTS